MNPNQTCELILQQIKESNLNFTLTETPFSVTLNIKKSFINYKSGLVKSSGFSSSNFQILNKSFSTSTKNNKCNITTQTSDLKAAPTQFKSSSSSTNPLTNIPAHKPTPTIVNQFTQKQLNN